MAKKMEYDKPNKRTLMRMNALNTGIQYCMCCKRKHKSLFKYWWEPDIGGADEPPRHTLMFCGVDCFRKYHAYEVEAFADNFNRRKFVST
jgi:hypothetical protein